MLILSRNGENVAFRSGEIRLVSAICSYGAAVIENRRLALAMREAGRIRGEIESARRIQEGLLPAGEPHVAGLAVAGTCLPADDVGGDYFGYTRMTPSLFGLSIADVSGHSIGAAIGMVMARCLIQSEAHRCDSPGAILARVNTLLCRDLIDPGMFVTAVFGVYDERSGVLTYSNAGHNPPRLLRASTRSFEVLDGSGLGLGIDPAADYPVRRVALNRGDLLVLYTDGATEARSREGEMFGVDRLERTIQEAAGRPPRDITNAIVDCVARWRGAAGLADDLTVVVARKE